MNERINISIIIKNENVISENVKEWFQLMSYFIPTDMSCKKLTKRKIQKFNSKKFYENINAELDTADNNNIMIKDSKNSISIRKGRIDEGVSLFSCDLEYEIFEKNKSYILSIIDKYMIDYEGIVAYACSLEDWFWQNNEDIQMYELRDKSMKGIVIRKSDIFPDDDIVDIEFNPGHSHIVDGIWFGSCWSMWYGKEYFKYIPKEVLMKFTSCYENKELSDNCIRITLYENPWEYGKEENRDKQIKFRTSVGVDKIAHSLENDEKLYDEIDSSIEITEGSFKHGGIRLMKYYYDSKNELTIKSRASEVRIYELGQEGTILWSAVEKIN